MVGVTVMLRVSSGRRPLFSCRNATGFVGVWVPILWSCCITAIEPASHCGTAPCVMHKEFKIAPSAIWWDGVGEVVDAFIRCQLDVERAAVIVDMDDTNASSS